MSDWLHFDFSIEMEKTLNWRPPIEMKRQYWYILFFVAWCFASGWWYLFGLKGVKTDPKLFSPQTTSISIAEILLMLLVACLVGFAIAWSILSEVIDDQQESREKLLSDNSAFFKINKELKAHIEMWKAKHLHDISLSQQKMNETISARDKLQRQVEELEARPVQQESPVSAVQLEQLETEAGTLRYRIRQLEYQNKEHEEAYAKLKHELEALQQARKERVSHSEHPFVRPVEPDEKDNLTDIKGIGPFIEKRLNMLGIYTFKQLSELTPELIDRVGNAIEFFPGRIERENWIGQARNFAK